MRLMPAAHLGRTGDPLHQFNQLARPRVFTNGVFDLLHRGHCNMLAAARGCGASLTVAVNADASARRLGKGPGRPINSAADRAAVVAALAAVDLVLVFDEDTPCALLQQLQPEVYVKGGDYAIDRLAETALVASWGGHAIALPFEHGLSSTAIVQRVLRAHAAEGMPAGALA